MEDSRSFRVNRPLFARTPNRVAARPGVTGRRSGEGGELWSPSTPLQRDEFRHRRQAERRRFGDVVGPRGCWSPAWWGRWSAAHPPSRPMSSPSTRARPTALNYSTQAFEDFATRGMLWRRACNPEGPGLRGLVTANVVRPGRIKRGARSLFVLRAPPGTHFTTFVWSGSAVRTDCRYALQLWAYGPDGPTAAIKNVRANHRCTPSESKTQIAGWPTPSRLRRAGRHQHRPARCLHGRQGRALLLQPGAQLPPDLHGAGAGGRRDTAGGEHRAEQPVHPWSVGEWRSVGCV